MTPPAVRGRLLVVDDEIQLMTALCEALRDEWFEADGLADPAPAPEALRAGEFDGLLSDLMMPGTDGIGLLEQALVGVITTGQGSIPTAVEAMKAGAFGYVLKPFRMQQVLPILGRAMAVRRLRLENVRLPGSGGCRCGRTRRRPRWRGTTGRGTCGSWPTWSSGPRSSPRAG